MTTEATSSMTIKAAARLLAEKLWPILLSAFISGCSYLHLKGTTIISDPRYGQYSLVVMTTLLFLAIVSLVYSVRTYRRYGRFREAYGVLWDTQFNMRCMNCHKPLKHSSHGPEVFYCCDPKCNNKYVLRNSNGNTLTKQQAIDFLRSDPD